jgi:replicative DNA helicase
MDLKKKIFAENLTPTNPFAEQAILNIFLTNSQNISLLKDNLPNLNPYSFYDESNRLIYQTICELSEKNLSVNLTSVLSTLLNKGILKKIGGVEKITTILNKFENSLNLPEYIRLINDAYMRRLIINLANQYKVWAGQPSLNIDEILQKIEKSLFELSKEKISPKVEIAAEIIDEIYEDMRKKKNSDFGFLTSFKDFDSIIQGFQKSDLIIIAGRPSMGKTAFSLNIGKNIVEKYDIPLVIFTLEMSRQQILYRFISSESKVNSNRLKSGKMSVQEINNLAKTMEKISKMPIYIDDTPILNLLDIRTKLLKIFNEKTQNGIVIIDYLQLMTLNMKLENRVQEISYITRNLKLMAKEFNIPILLLSQLSRNVESRVNKRPMLSDLRESGCISIEKKTKFNSWNLEKKIKNKSTSFELKGIKPTYLVIFENNVHIELTSTHKILSEKGWIKISEICKNTKIYCLIQKKEEKEIKKYQYNKVKNIIYKGIQAVYDKLIPIHHNFLLKNIILHNSIEQDADVVIMLYREDYYNERNIRPQIIEFIVAKHRNGPTGTAKLFFDSTTTTFNNMNNSY